MKVINKNIPNFKTLDFYKIPLKLKTFGSNFEIFSPFNAEVVSPETTEVLAQPLSNPGAISCRAKMYQKTSYLYTYRVAFKQNKLESSVKFVFYSLLAPYTRKGPSRQQTVSDKQIFKAFFTFVSSIAPFSQKIRPQKYSFLRAFFFIFSLNCFCLIPLISISSWPLNHYLASCKDSVEYRFRGIYTQRNPLVSDQVTEGLLSSASRPVSGSGGRKQPISSQNVFLSLARRVLPKLKNSSLYFCVFLFKSKLLPYVRTEMLTFASKSLGKKDSLILEKGFRSQHPTQTVDPRLARDVSSVVGSDLLACGVSKGSLVITHDQWAAKSIFSGPLVTGSDRRNYGGIGKDHKSFFRLKEIHKDFALRTKITESNRKFMKLAVGDRWVCRLPQENSIIFSKYILWF